MFYKISFCAAASNTNVKRFTSPTRRLAYLGLAIYSAINKHPQPITVEIDGIAASIASVIAMSGRPVRMASNAMLMMHNATAFTAGDAVALRKQADTLEQVQLQLVDVYARKTKLPVKKIMAMMAEETWLSAADALDLGFIDEIMQPMKMAAHFDLSKYRNAPPVISKQTPRLDAYRARYVECCALMK
jgi:ATP-dependent Clp protease, protease subunit